MKTRFRIITVALILAATSARAQHPHESAATATPPAPEIQSGLELVAVLESMMRRDSDHPEANQFYIHVSIEDL
jgi:hypothetical protein